ESAPQRDHTLRDVIEGLRYLVRTGAPWRYLPGDFPHRATEEKPWQGGRRLLAVAAQAVELDPVRLEAIAGGVCRLGLHGRDAVHLHILDPPAAPADDMRMRRGPQPVVMIAAVAELQLQDLAHL